MKNIRVWIVIVFALLVLVTVLLYLRAGNQQLSPEIMHPESLGDMHIDMPGSKVIKLLGEPQDKNEQLLSEADALFHQEWRYQSDL